MTPAKGRPVRILVVCTGNICRSPLAEQLLREGLAAAGVKAVVTSAGTHAMTIAAGSVMKEPRIGATIRIESHHAATVPRPRPANARRHCSAKRSTGRVEAIAMMTTTNIGSVKLTFRPR